MKTVDELKKLRDESLKKMDMRFQKDGFRIQVGMGTCGIASGARPIMNAFLEQVDLNDLKNVMVTQVGCMGECAHEPMAEVIDEDGQSFVYCALTVPMVNQIVEKHIMGHEPITKYLLTERKDKSSC